MCKRCNENRKFIAISWAMVLTYMLIFSKQRQMNLHTLDLTAWQFISRSFQISLVMDTANRKKIRFHAIIFSDACERQLK